MLCCWIMLMVKEAHFGLDSFVDVAVKWSGVANRQIPRTERDFLSWFEILWRWFT